MMLLLLALFNLLAFPQAPPAEAPGVQPVLALAEGSAEEPQDPAYKLYRNGYNLILEERWAEAQQRFEEVLAKYPRSRYADDAMYWSAFALKQTDRARAIQEYSKFLERFPRSNYLEDAMADFAALSAQLPRMADSLAARMPDHREFLFPGRDLVALELNVRRLRRSAGEVHTHLSVISPFAYRFDIRELDQRTRLKLDALAALGNTGDDDQAFRTLSETALDHRQPPLFRTVALQALTGSLTHDPLPVLVEAAEKDSSKEVQCAAIVYIGRVRRNPARSVETLGSLYEKRNDEQVRRAILDAAAGLGTDEAFTFLARVAHTETDGDLQTSAIDYLSVTGRDKRRNVEILVDIFRTLPQDRRRSREAALYGVAEIGNERAVDFLTEVARGEHDFALRRNAIFYLGNIGGEKARRALRAIFHEP